MACTQLINYGYTDDDGVRQPAVLEEEPISSELKVAQF